MISTVVSLLVLIVACSAEPPIYLSPPYLQKYGPPNFHHAPYPPALSTQNVHLHSIPHGLENPHISHSVSHQIPAPAYGIPENPISTQNVVLQPSASYGLPPYTPEIHHHHHHHQGENTPGVYNFEYKVDDNHTGDHKSHEESSDGHVVKGKYSFLQPDGKIRTVTYHAGKHTGFNAHVSYSPSAPPPIHIGY